jgi:hypothetical protein
MGLSMIRLTNGKFPRHIQACSYILGIDLVGGDTGGRKSTLSIASLIRFRESRKRNSSAKRHLEPTPGGCNSANMTEMGRRTVNS